MKKFIFSVLDSTFQLAYKKLSLDFQCHIKEVYLQLSEKIFKYSFHIYICMRPNFLQMLYPANRVQQIECSKYENPDVLH